MRRCYRASKKAPKAGERRGGREERNVKVDQTNGGPKKGKKITSSAIAIASQSGGCLIFKKREKKKQAPKTLSSEGWRSVFRGKTALTIRDWSSEDGRSWLERAKVIHPVCTPRQTDINFRVCFVCATETNRADVLAPRCWLARVSQAQHCDRRRLNHGLAHSHTCAPR